MNFNWSDIKELFFAIGSIAGVMALIRPLIESKYQRDAIRANDIQTVIREQVLIDLESYIYQQRQVRDEYFHPFDLLVHQFQTSQNAVRFTGPLAKFLRKELESLVNSYLKLRDYIQVNEWEPTTHRHEDGTEYVTWDFNKSAFRQQDGIARDYAEHLYGAAEQAVQMRQAFQRFQLVAELHLFEVPIAKWLLPRRYKAHGF